MASCLLQFVALANDIEPGKEFYSAKKTVNPIVLDGNLAEWTGADVLADPRFAIPKGSGAAGTYVNFEPYNGGTWTGPDDQTSNVRVVYDDENVYFGFVVTDDYHENSANSAWNGDSVQLMVANDTRDSQVGLYNYALGGIEGALGGVIVMHEAGPGGTTAVVTRDAATKRTTYEIQLPKSAMGLETLAAGVQFGLGMAINDGDQDTPGQRGWGGLGAHALVFGKSPSETALITLAAPPPPREQNNDIEPGKEFYTAIKAANPIVMDGELTEWRGAQLLADPRFSIPKGSKAAGTLVNFEPYNGGTWTGPDDQTSNVQVVYDDDNVYFGFVVTDDYHENAANSAWNGDSVQLMVANATRDAQVGLYNYALGGVEDALGNIIIMHEAGPGGTTAVVTRNTVTKRTTYEIKLPKEALGLDALTGGVKFGLGMAINDGDKDTPGQRGWGGLGAHALVFGKSPSETAMVTLAAANDIEPGKEFYFASPASGTITVDGALTDWSGVSVLSDPRFAVPKGSGSRAGGGALTLFEVYNGGTWTGPDDQTSAVQIAYDTENVYFGFVVTDDYHENSANSAWNGDSVQLMIASATQDAQVALYNYALGGVEGSVGTTIVMHEAGPGGTSALVTRNAVTKRTTYEIKLPKASLGLDELKVGTMFGLGMAINDGDKDTPGQRGWGGLGAHALVFGKSPQQTALVTLGIGGSASPCFLSAISPPKSLTPNKFSFRGNDFEGCIVDPAATKLLIDGVVVPLVASPKVLGATDFTYTLPVPFATGTEHTFVIELRDTRGTLASVERSTFTAPVIYKSNLVGGGKWKTEQVWTRGNPEVIDVIVAEEVLNGASTYPAADQIVAKTPYVHYDDNVGPPIYIGLSQPFPLWDPANGGSGRGDHNHFATRSTAQISVIEAGTHWFVCNSDDGFSLRIDGTEIGSAGLRGRTNTVMSVDLTKGPHNVEFIFFEAGGGAGVSLYVMKGTSAAEQLFNEDSYELVPAWLNPTDTDGDGMLDTYEAENSLNPAVNDAAQDKDGDGLTNLVESQLGTRADKGDTDSDGLADAVETNTAVWVSLTNTGTNPLGADTDRDGLKDGAENNSGTFVSSANTGTNPLSVDTDGDTFSDGTEALYSSANPNSAASLPLRPGMLDLLAYWDFNSDANPAESLDVVKGFRGLLKTGTVYSADKGGRTGAAGDKSVDMGASGNSGTGVVVEGAGFLSIAGSQNQVAISYWQNLWDTPDSSSIYAQATSVERGINVHAPWSNGRIYFDTSGCCDGGTQRIDEAGNLNPGVWEHIVLNKNGNTKAIWVNGVKILEGVNTAPLALNFTNFFMGTDPGSYNMAGAIDDVAVYGDALSDAQIAQLFAGTKPNDPSLVPPNVAPVSISVTSFSFDAATSVLNLAFTSEVGSNYTLEYTTGFQAAGAPTTASKWNVVPGYVSIPGAAGMTAITPLNTATLVAPGGQLPNNTSSYFRIRKL